jgi:hypothetical protein
MTDNNIVTETRKQLDRELNLGLGISKALGDLRFLAERVNGKDSSFGITEGMAVMDALHAVQQAQIAWQEISCNKLVKA